MGNGYPVAAVVTRRELAERFPYAGRTFSTFGGNPVAASAAIAVLDVLEDERLPERAAGVGERLRASLESLGKADIVEVRGTGLLAGVQLASEGLAARVVDELREHGILVGLTGPNGDVLKIRPPLVFADEHAELLVTALDRHPRLNRYEELLSRIVLSWPSSRPMPSSSHAAGRATPTPGTSSWSASRATSTPSAAAASGCRSTDAEDVFQEVFSRAFERLGELRNDEAVRPWLAQLTRRLCIDRLRLSARDTPAESELDEQAADDVLATLDDAMTVRAALDKVGDPCREILDRFFCRDESYRTIGDLLELPAGTIASRISRCLDKVRSELDGRAEGSRPS